MKLEDEAILSYYKELERINRHSDVCLVRHIQSQQIFIKKNLPATSEPIYRMLKELQVPGTPEVFHVINDDNSVIIIEEFINGMTLSEYLDQRGPLPEKDALHIIRSLCTILKGLHQASRPIIHRDIKPSNIIIDSDLNPALIDFDASKVFDLNKTRDTVLMGTAGFAAPEQFGFAQSDARTDIYALGILLNVMLTGKFPIDFLCPGHYSSVIRKCTSIDPADRYNDAKALMTTLNGTTKLPPGFRTKTPWKIIVASMVYIFIVCSSLWLIVEGNPPMWWVAANRICAFLCMISIVFFTCDYIGVSSKLPISSSPNLVIKWIGRLFWSACAVTLIIIILAIISP